MLRFQASEQARKERMQQTIFDIGMYDGTDTAYYLESGYRVVSVEANPLLVDNAKRQFESAIAAGQLLVVNAAISSDGKPVSLVLSGDSLAASSVIAERIAHRRPVSAIRVTGVTLPQLFADYGVPHFLKVDIEGADRLCVLSLTRESRPEFLSFEVGDDADELIAYAASIGFSRFKIMNQSTFRELANQDPLSDRAIRRLIKYLGYQEPLYVRRAGRFFKTVQCSGPVPWLSGGSWSSSDAIRSRLKHARSSNLLAGWYDVHATI